jgi:hypothetical protein
MDRQTMRLIYTVVSLSLLAAACEGKSLTSPASDAQSARVPLNHRASGISCPAQRAPGSPASDPCTNDGELSVATLGGAACTSDSDCTAGSNGRCNPVGAPIAICGATCTYDACASDSDCPDNQACDCRPSASASSANSCLTGGNCRVDSDCGSAGYCSPSQVNNFCFCPSPALCADGGGVCYDGNQQVSCACGDSCGHSYFCHTKSDRCVDDSDCDAGQTCNYDTVNARWDCGTCWPVP